MSIYNIMYLINIKLLEPQLLSNYINITYSPMGGLALSAISPWIVCGSIRTSFTTFPPRI